MKAQHIFQKPMLAKETGTAFDDPDWLFEIKWDGYRAISVIRKQQVSLYSRNHHSFQGKFPLIEQSLKEIQHDCVLDGEIIVMNKKGLSEFGLLQDPEQKSYSRLRYIVFDLLWLNGTDLTVYPLEDRKSLLKELVKGIPAIIYNEHILEKGSALFKQVIKKGHEGIIAKKKDGHYYAGKRTGDWLKIKTHKTTEALVVGYTKSLGARPYFGSLVLAQYNEQHQLVSIGMAGSGFTDKELAGSFKTLQKLRTLKAPVDITARGADITWVVPKLICEVRYTERTRDGKLRHPVFLRWRDDKSAKEIQLNDPADVMESTERKNAMISKKRNATAPVTHPEKLYWPREKISKQMLVDYYQSVADYLLPFIKNRPQSLLRNPGGIEAKGFFHKDAGEDVPSFIKTYKVYSESSKKDIDYIVCNNKSTLAYLNNLGCIELNPWHSTTLQPDTPDYAIIDLDPSEKNNFKEVIEVALYFNAVLKKIGITGFCKTSGSTGLHIYIPMGRKYHYDQVLPFMEILCLYVEKQLPELTTTVRSLSKRSKHKIYLDYGQNRKGQTICSVYSVRPKKGAPVSMPVSWAELKSGLSPLDFNIHNALKKIKKQPGLFKGVLGKGISMQQALKKLKALDDMQ